jgi:hypothetical protein
VTRGSSRDFYRGVIASLKGEAIHKDEEARLKWHGLLRRSRASQ